MYGGSSRITVSAVRLISRPRSSAAVDQRRRVAGEFDAGDQSGAAHVDDRRVTRAQRAQALEQVRGRAPHATPAGRDRARRARRARRGTRAGCRRTSCRGRRRKSLPRRARDIIAAPTGMPPPSALPSAIEIRRQPDRRRVQELSRAARSALHFVGNQQRARSRARGGNRASPPPPKSAARRLRPGWARR